MHTTTLLAVLGGVVVAKSSAFATYVVWRGRRQRRELDLVAAEAAASASTGEPEGWRLQWAEPGVMLVQNVSGTAAARDVALTATLTTSAGTVATVEQAVRFVGTGACFEARFAAIQGWLGAVAEDSFAERGSDRVEARRRLASTLSYSMVWSTPDGEQRCEVRTDQAVLPVPDLAPEPA